MLYNKTAEGRCYHFVLPFAGANCRLKPKLWCNKCGERAMVAMLAIWPQKQCERRVTMPNGGPARLRIGTVLKRQTDKARNF